MRLTLRTLLAYMDDILEPADLEEIRKKIETSEVATDLLHKSRDTMRRLRLGAPPVLGGNDGLDPNLTAEYLDNALSPEEVANFERVCLDSDVHLAEACSCHQILTMVLGAPADIDPASRRRMYTLPSEVEYRNQQLRMETAHLATTSAEDASEEHITTTSSHAETNHSRVPDYLRPSFAQRHKIFLGIVAALAASVGGVLLYHFTHPQDTSLSKTAQVDGLGEKPEVTPAPIDDIAPNLDPSTADEVAPVFKPADTANSENPVTIPVADSTETKDPTIEVPSIEVSAIEAPAIEISPSLSSEEGTDASEIPMTSTPDLTPPPALPMGPDGLAAPMLEAPGEGVAVEGTAVPPVTPVAPATPGVIEVPAVESPATENPMDPIVPVPMAEGGTEEVPAVTPDPNTIAKSDITPEGGVMPLEGEEVAPPAKAESRHLATYLANNEILLRFNPEDSSWIRVPERAKLFAGDMLISLPASRPNVAIVSGINVQLHGGTRIRLVDQGPEAPIEIEFIYGKLILDSTNLARTSASLKIGETRAVLHFDGAATVAISVDRSLAPGANPLTASALTTAQFYSASGDVTWSADGAEVQITSPASWELNSNGFTVPTSLEAPSEPSWMAGKDISNGDALAIRSFEKKLEAEKPVELTLQELVDPAITSQQELRSLASRACVHIGIFAPFIESLNDPEQHALWNEHILTLKEAMSLSPKDAKNVEEAISKRKGNDSEEFFRLLWGYTPEQVTDEVLIGLIRMLDHDSLDFRVLAFQNLKQIAGKQFNYRPHENFRLRQRAYKEWLKRYNDKSLMPKKASAEPPL